MPNADESERIWRAVGTVSDRITNLETTVGQREAVMREVIHSAVADAMPSALLNDEQLRWVELAIKKEAQSIRFRQAVIEKSTSALVWSAIVGLGIVFKEWLSNHGFRLP